ncbi:MAG: PilZ domain-containing protein [Proteobacteria bacterium]|nr:PilZ domain-containing protein [Pseudomonadota bacterium]MBU1710215.1 PilZ domain-containing protein [Pseudomonadota bacterium]
MRRVWAESPETITQEINLLIDDQTRLNFCQKTAPNQVVFLSAIEPDDSGSCIKLTKRNAFGINPGECFLFYKRVNQLMRGFKSLVLNNDRKNITASLPSEIFEIQRRKHPRLTTPGNSRATFIPDGKQRLITCRVLDVTLDGARLVGNFSSSIKKDDILKPLSLSLCLRYSDLEHKINITQARVAWVAERSKDQRLMGVYFTEQNTDLEQLKHYLHLRLLEDKSA